jgi:hypothetical protein
VRAHNDVRAFACRPAIAVGREYPESHLLDDQFDTIFFFKDAELLDWGAGFVGR